MGFVADSSARTSEVLFLGGSPGLGRLDTDSLSVSLVAPYDGLYGPNEITGTPDGRLFGFFQSAEAAPEGGIAELDPSTAATISVHPLSGLPFQQFAFAFFAGDFWLFSSSGIATVIRRFRPAGGTTTVMRDDQDFNVIGAGASTCDPKR